MKFNKKLVTLHPESLGKASQFHWEQARLDLALPDALL